MSTKSTKRPVFKCQQCGECCQGIGGILLQPEEMAQITAFLNLDPEDLKARYLVASPLGLQVAAQDGACVFLHNHRCLIHPVKPRICRQWPFLPALLAHPDEFEAAKGACPGLAPAASHQDFLKAASEQI